MTKSVKTEFSTRLYEFSHGKAPRGYGSWAFSIEGGEPVWAPSSTYADARKWAKAKAAELAPEGFTGSARIEVLS